MDDNTRKDGVLEEVEAPEESRQPYEAPRTEKHDPPEFVAGSPGGGGGSSYTYYYTTYYYY